MNKLIILSLIYLSDKDLINFTTIGLQAAANTFQHNLLRGIRKNYTKEVIILNCLPVVTWPKQFKKIKLNDNEFEIEKCRCIEIGCINFPVLKQIQRSIKLKKILDEIIEKDDGILLYSTYLPFLWAIAHTKNNNSTLIVTDLPEYYDLQKVSGFRLFLRKVLNQLIYKYLSKIKKFVLLTEQMKDPLKIGKRPYVVVEGICNSDQNNFTERYEIKEKEIIFYSGSLAYSSGIIDLIDVIEEINNQSVELWICGKGEAAKIVENRSINNKRIRYYGFVTKEKVDELRSYSTLLVNPRKNVGDFTKYSFPSKTMEYMTSGKPIIMYKLEGIPDEYWDYIYCINDITKEALREKIEEVISIPYQKRISLAKKAQNFVISKKNEYVQSKKIIKLMEE